MDSRGRRWLPRTSLPRARTNGVSFCGLLGRWRSLCPLYCSPPLTGKSPEDKEVFPQDQSCCLFRCFCGACNKIKPYTIAARFIDCPEGGGRPRRAPFAPPVSSLRPLAALSRPSRQQRADFLTVTARSHITHLQIAARKRDKIYQVRRVTRSLLIVFQFCSESAVALPMHAANPFCRPFARWRWLSRVTLFLSLCDKYRQSSTPSTSTGRTSGPRGSLPASRAPWSASRWIMVFSGS